MRVCFAEGYHAPLPDGHRFPMGKFAALHKTLLAESLISPNDVIVPEEAPWEDLGLVHGASFLCDLKDGTLDAKAERRMGLPWSEAIVRRSRLATQGSVTAGRQALRDGIAANLAGGMHHGFPDHGEGFCVLNDVAVAVRVLRRDGDAERFLLVDLDVHQGNGNAAVFADDPGTFTFSMHGARNYPFKKMTSDLDVALPDGLGDEAYLDTLRVHLEEAMDRARPDLVYYLAGVDPLAGDRFGLLSMSYTGLGQRDRFVLEVCKRRHVPIALVLSGGYAKTPEETGWLHAEVHRQAAEVYR